MKSDEDADDATDAICASVADHEADAAAAAHLEGDDAEDPNDHRGDDAKWLGAHLVSRQLQHAGRHGHHYKLSPNS